MDIFKNPKFIVTILDVIVEEEVEAKLEEQEQRRTRNGRKEQPRPDYPREYHSRSDKAVP